jgi:hypothetical protein
MQLSSAVREASLTGARDSAQDLAQVALAPAEFAGWGFSGTLQRPTDYSAATDSTTVLKLLMLSPTGSHAWRLML